MEQVKLHGSPELILLGNMRKPVTHIILKIHEIIFTSQISTHYNAKGKRNAIKQTVKGSKNKHNSVPSTRLLLPIQL